MDVAVVDCHKSYRLQKAIVISLLYFQTAWEPTDKWLLFVAAGTLWRVDILPLTLGCSQLSDGSSIGLIWPSAPAGSALVSMKQRFCCGGEGWGYSGCLPVFLSRDESWCYEQHSKSIHLAVEEANADLWVCSIHGNCGRESVLLPTCSKQQSRWFSVETEDTSRIVQRSVWGLVLVFF